MPHSRQGLRSVSGCNCGLRRDRGRALYGPCVPCFRKVFFDKQRALFSQYGPCVASGWAGTDGHGYKRFCVSRSCPYVDMPHPAFVRQVDTVCAVSYALSSGRSVKFAVDGTGVSCSGAKRDMGGSGRRLGIRRPVLFEGAFAVQTGQGRHFRGVAVP